MRHGGQASRSTLRLVLVTAVLVTAASGIRATQPPPIEPWAGEPGVSETVAEIMARQAEADRFIGPNVLRQIDEYPMRPAPVVQDQDATAVSQWPAAGAMPGGLSQPGAENPQMPGLSFKAISLTLPVESMYVPPDSVGDVGPEQFLVAANGRIKVIYRNGAAGALSATLDVLFNSVRNGLSVTDPQVRYDRLSGHFFVTAVTIGNPNRVVIAMSNTAVITNAGQFTFFYFQQDLVAPAGQTNGLLDYDSLGVDNNALYIGGNVFTAARAFIGSTGFVVRKASLLGGGPIVVTAFRDLGTATVSGPWAPRGVDHDDPAATEGYFIGVDTLTLGRLILRRISSPGGSPSISGNINISVPTTTFPIDTPAQGSTHPLDALDDRLFAARLEINRLTGVASLWTAHNIQVDATGVANAAGGRNGSRWYELRDLTATPTLFQAGTLFDPAASNPRFFWIPSVAMSGQGHMVIGASTAGVLFRAGVALAGRLAGDPPGATQAASLVTGASSGYNVESVTPQRWGDYSATVVDPNDDMTIWTFQEYCDGTNSWGVRIVQLSAPRPATPAAAGSVCQGSPAADVVVTGSTVQGSGFFDPGPDPGGPGFPNHIAASVTGGVVVNSVQFDSPTQLTLNVSTTNATPGPQDVAVTNPDGQLRSGPGILNVIATPPPPLTSNDGPACNGGTLALSAMAAPGTPPGALAYSWSGPNGFASLAQYPILHGIAAADAGLYQATLFVDGCASTSSMTAVVVNDDAGACGACGTCQAGLCLAPDNDADGFAGTCDNCPSVPNPGQENQDGDPLGNACDCAPLDSGTWAVPGEVSGLLLSLSGPEGGGAANLDWFPPTTGGLGPSMLYDVVRSPSASDLVGPAICLESNDGPVGSAFDAELPPVGGAFFYVVRPQDSCGAGIASRNSGGVVQPALDCP